MNWDIIKGNWKQMKGQVQSKWGELTDDEIDQAEGDRERLVGLIQERYGVAKDEAERQIDEFIAEHKSAA
ncbi:CsbD family protein [uncultured Roseobacter sp.]|uniref:CsbD family protein n=1 Tax=uncultured Roseobacter sp. TaxID=114847 RepID=UPI002637CF30|nr:CsbD family protein [uncultured Roseobacter sp.]